MLGKRKPQLTEKHLELLHRLYTVNGNPEDMEEHPEFALELLLRKMAEEAERESGTLLRHLLRLFCYKGTFQHNLEEREKAAKEKKALEVA